MYSRTSTTATACDDRPLQASPLQQLSPAVQDVLCIATGAAARNAPSATCRAQAPDSSPYFSRSLAQASTTAGRRTVREPLPAVRMLELLHKWKAISSLPIPYGCHTWLSRTVSSSLSRRSAARHPSLHPYTICALRPDRHALASQAQAQAQSGYAPSHVLPETRRTAPFHSPAVTSSPISLTPARTHFSTSCPQSAKTIPRSTHPPAVSAPPGLVGS